MADIIQEIIKQINKAQSIALYCHTNPDGDTVGSSLALFFALKKRGKDIDVYCDTNVKSKFAGFEGAEFITLPDKRVHDLAISVDCSDIGRLGNSMKSYLSARGQIAIDHHKSFERFAELSLVDSSASACGEIVFKLIKALKALDDTIAKLLFSAIVTDSGCFAFSNTTRATHAIAYELLGYDFDAADTIYKVYRQTDLKAFNLENRILGKCKFFSEGRIAIITFLKSDFEATGTSSEDTEGIISEVIDVDTVKVAYALSEVGDKNYKLSIRTKDPVDASECALLFGGGGHKYAAGCRINGYLEDIMDRLVKIADDRL